MLQHCGDKNGNSFSRVCKRSSLAYREEVLLRGVHGKYRHAKLRQLAGDAVALRPRAATQTFSREHCGRKPDRLLEAAVGSTRVAGDHRQTCFEGLARQLLVYGFERLLELR